MRLLFGMPVTISVIVLCAIICFIIHQKTEYNATDNVIVYKYSLIPMQIKRGQYYRLLTSGFIHVQIYHLAMNMYSLYNLGSFLEPFLGSGKFALLLILSIIGGGICCTFLSSPGSLTIGISGGIFGLLGAYFVILFQYGLFAQFSIQSYLLRIILVNVLISMMPGISWQGHLGGVLTGIVVAFLFFLF